MVTILWLLLLIVLGIWLLGFLADIAGNFVHLLLILALAILLYNLLASRGTA